MKKTFMLVAAVAVIGIAGGFYGGMQYQKTKAPARGDFSANAGRILMQNGNRQGFAGMVSGTILAKDATSITVGIASGQEGQSGSRIVLFSDATEIMKSAAATSNDLAVGTTIMVRGTSNGDGSITAQSIQLNPAVPSRNPQK